ncbi:response regulator transcription factor [Salinispirillum marinum]|uniref:Response regulator transcription factor n=2 Tax=Saccharospirillaceae TaxID=255527 RepID=A0ABV8BEA0_9GAMM
MTTILIIDDEPQIQRFLAISLRSQGYQVVSALNGQEGLVQAAVAQPDLILLDLGLPDVDGQHILKTLRLERQTPVIVLSVRASEHDKVEALDHGANDYVEKPFSVKELLARIRRLLRDRVMTVQEGYDDGVFALNALEHKVTYAGQPVHLSRKEFALLKALVEHPGRLLTQEHLLHHIWGRAYQDQTHNLRILVGRLRARLADHGLSPQCIETEPGVGYRFNPPLSNAPDRSAS